MPSETLNELRRHRKDLWEKVYRLQEIETVPEGLPDLAPGKSEPVDPLLQKALETAFDQTPKGKEEAVNMEIDVLRRLSRCRETERIYRAFGVLILATPVRAGGQTVYAFQSGPIKVSPWTDQEKSTLSKLCGVPIDRLPPDLDQVAVFTPEQVEAISRQQVRSAALMEMVLRNHTNAKPSSPASSHALPGSMDLLQPGFADHLDLLFSIIQSETSSRSEPTPVGRERIQNAVQRGRHVVDQVRRAAEAVHRAHEPIAVHTSLTSWAEGLASELPHLRINFSLKATSDEVIANPYNLNHLLYTLLAGVADGLPEGRALLGVGSRNVQHDGAEALHIEIRDGGGLATFAGTGAPIDHQILMEQNQSAGECADWLFLAERIDADLRIAQDDGVVTRVELFLPLHKDLDHQGEHEESAHSVWVVEDDDQEFVTLERMLEEASVTPRRLHTAAELREHYLQAAAPPELILLKYLLPDERGAHLRTWLYEQDSDLPVVLISSFSATHPGIATVGNLPSTMTLQKPFDTQALLDILRITLDETLPGT